jgi:hypothetical protein
MKLFINFRWAGLLLMISAVAVVLVPPLERLYNTEGGLPGFLFTLWFFCNTLGMIGLSFFYSSGGSKRAGWINVIGLICLYSFWVMVFAKGTWEIIAWFGIGFSSILFVIAANLSNRIPRWVMVTWLLAAAAAMTSQSFHQVVFFDYVLNWWNLGLGLASFGAGLAVFKQAFSPQEFQTST